MRRSDRERRTGWRGRGYEGDISRSRKGGRSVWLLGGYDSQPDGLGEHKAGRVGGRLGGRAGRMAGPQSAAEAGRCLMAGVRTIRRVRRAVRLRAVGNGTVLSALAAGVRVCAQCGMDAAQQPARSDQAENQHRAETPLNVGIAAQRHSCRHELSRSAAGTLLAGHYATSANALNRRQSPFGKGYENR